MAGSQLECRGCGAVLSEAFVDLGASPLANSYLSAEEVGEPETYYPLTVFVCTECFLVQLPEVRPPSEIFGTYAYFSSYSDTWLKHAEAYTESVLSRLALNSGHLVVEIASNDGYLLQFFRRHGIPVLGVEPAANVARAAQAAGIPTLIEFFGTAVALQLVNEERQADLLIANNVLAHVPNLNDFVAGIKIVLKAGGLATLEFPHLMRLMAEAQFDTIYHEHFSYFSLAAVQRVFARHGLAIVDVEELPTHGGSLRLHVRHGGEASIGPHVMELLAREETAGLNRLDTYVAFGDQVKETKRELLAFLIDAKRRGRRVAGYGAPAKGNTLLNYCGIRSDFLDYTVDRSPHKQGRFLPGTHLPIHPPEMVRQTKPDYLLILPWNLRDEVMAQMAYIREWGGRFVVPIPRVTVYP